MTDCLGSQQSPWSPSPQRLHLRTRPINGETAPVSFAPYKTLLEVLREDLDLTGTKHGCELGECGACTVLLDGEPVLSCLVLALECGGRKVGNHRRPRPRARAASAAGRVRRLRRLAVRLLHPRVIMTAKSLLRKISNPTKEEIKAATAGNLCRCTGYQQITEAIEDAARQLREERK